MAEAAVARLGLQLHTHGGARMRQAQCVGCAQRGVMFSSVLHVLPTRYTGVGSHLKRGIWHGAGKAWAWGHSVFPQQVSHDTAQCVAVSPPSLGCVPSAQDRPLCSRSPQTPCLVWGEVSLEQRTTWSQWRALQDVGM